MNWRFRQYWGMVSSQRGVLFGAKSHQLVFLQVHCRKPIDWPTEAERQVINLTQRSPVIAHGNMSRRTRRWTLLVMSGLAFRFNRRLNPDSCIKTFVNILLQKLFSKLSSLAFVGALCSNEASSAFFILWVVLSTCYLLGWCVHVVSGQRNL